MSDIKTEHVNPPIPIRKYDWSAVRDGYQEGDLIGWGESEQAAIDDLLLSESDRWDKCDWCEKLIKEDLIDIDCNHLFCCTDCENNYYADRSIRKRSGKIPLFLERSREKANQPPIAV